MKKIFLGMVVGVIAAFGEQGVVDFSEVTDYHEFYHTNGMSIYARVIQYDAEAGEVELESKRKGERQWVELSLLREESQAYVINLGMPSIPKPSGSQQEESATTTEPLSAEEVEAIGEQYIEALKERDYGTLHRLYYKSNWHVEHVSERDKSVGIMKIHEVEGNNILIRYGHSEGLSSEGWIQLTLAGKIKYCPLNAPHPIEQAVRACGYLYGLNNADNNESAEKKNSYIETLEESGIPLFGLHSDMTTNEVHDAGEQMMDWLMDNAGKYDNSEPMLLLPESQVKAVKDALQEMQSD